MPRTIVVSTSTASNSSRRRTKPRLLFRGEIRTILRKTLAKLRALRNRDHRENIRAALLDYRPALVDEGSTSDTAAAFDAVAARIEACMAAHEGDE